MRRFYMSIQDDMMSKYEGRYFSIEYYPQFRDDIAMLDSFFICSYLIIPELELFYAVTDKTSYQLYDSNSNGKLIEWTCPKEIYIDKFNSTDDVDWKGDTPAIYVKTYNKEVNDSPMAYIYSLDVGYAPGWEKHDWSAASPYKVYYVFKQRTTPLDTSPMFITENDWNGSHISAGRWYRYRDCLLTADLSHLDTSIYTGSENWYDLANYND